MKVFLTHLAALLAGAALLFFPCWRYSTRAHTSQAVDELHRMAEVVRSTYRTLDFRMGEQLTAFNTAVANDRAFAMALLVGHRRSAPEVSEIASRYMNAMGLTLLTLTDSVGSILSSGHFPANTGKNKSALLQRLGETGVFIFDTVKGVRVPTYQRAATFSIEGVAFSSIGGFIVDEQFLNRLNPCPGLIPVFQWGDVLLGKKVQTVSTLNDNSIIVNDSTFLATSLLLPAAQNSNAPLFFLLRHKSPPPAFPFFRSLEGKKEPAIPVPKQSP